MIRYLPAHVATWVLIVFTSGVYSQEKTGKCNVKIWYLDLVTEGALSGNLSDEQLLLKGKIEKMVDKYKKLGRADGMVDCSILQMYEELLGEASTDGRDTADSNGEKFNNDEKDNQDASNGKGKEEESEDISSKGEQENVKDDGEQKESENVNDDKHKENEDVKDDEKNESEDAKDGKQKESDDEDSERAESNDNEKGSKGAEKEGDKGTDKQEGNGSEEGGDNSEDEFADDTDLDDTDFGGDDEEGEDEMGGSQAEEESLNTEEEESSEDKDSLDKDSDEQDSESSENKDSDPSDKSSESSDENDSDSLDKEESGSSMETDSYSSQIKDSEPPAKDSSDGKESLGKEDERSSLDTDNKDSESITKDSEDSGENKKSNTDETQVRKRKTKSVEETVFDAKRGYVKVVKEVEVEGDEEEEKEEKEEMDTNEMIKETKQEKLEKENEKVIKEENKSDENTEDKKNEEQNKKENEEEKKKKEEEKERERKEKEDKEKMKEKEMEHVKKEEEKRAMEKDNKEEEDEEEEENENTKPWQKTKTKERKPWEKAKSKEESSENSCSGDACKEQNNSKEDSVYKYTAQAKHHKGSEDEEPTWRKSQQQNNKADDREKETKRVDSRDFTADLHRFEMLFQQRASEYASKIQNLEIMIIRLENQLLGERLNKQNSSNSFSKLENQILRLENELLKLNQSYVDLKEENVMLQYRQRKYLELGSDKSKDQSSMGNSTKHFELINKQQNKISELSALLMNHSALFDKLQSKSHALEEQNQALYQIVMNQTVLISNIMKKMQELSEENMKHRKETQDLKTQMEIKTNSDRLLEKLNTLVSVQIPGANVNEHRAKEQKSGGEILRIQSFFPKSPDADVIPWKCNGNNASRFCVFYSFILSPCPPFSTVYWHKCPYYYKDISQEHEIHQESSQTSEPTTTNPEVPPAESKNVDTVPPATSADNIVNVNDGVSEGALPTISSEDGKILEEILKPEKDSQHEEARTTEDASEEQSEKVEENVENKASKSEEKNQNPGKDSEDKGRLPSVEKVNVAPPKPAEPKHGDRKILYTTDKKLPKPRDCYEYNENGYERNGMYKIYVVGQEKHLPVYCDMNGGWTVIMKRSSGALDFYRDWDEYKKGFGGFYSEHWIGNDNLHYLTNQKHYSLKVVLEDFEFNSTFAMYDHFWIDGEDEGYRLHISGYSGTAGDGFAKHDKMRFSTKDADNDLITKELGEYDNSCAKRFTGAWWYYKCYMSNLTGQYYKNGKVPNKKFNGVSWKPWKKPNISLKSAIMMIRPFNAE